MDSISRFLNAVGGGDSTKLPKFGDVYVVIGDTNISAIVVSAPEPGKYVVIGDGLATQVQLAFLQLILIAESQLSELWAEEVKMYLNYETFSDFDDTTKNFNCVVLHPTEVPTFVGFIVGTLMASMTEYVYPLNNLRPLDIPTTGMPEEQKNKLWPPSTRTGKKDVFSLALLRAVLPP